MRIQDNKKLIRVLKQSLKLSQSYTDEALATMVEIMRIIEDAELTLGERKLVCEVFEKLSKVYKERGL